MADPTPRDSVPPPGTAPGGPPPAAVGSHGPEYYRQRYAELQAAGQAPGLPLPPPSLAADCALADSRIRERETVPGGWYWIARLARGEALRLINPHATPGVALLAWNADDPSERYNAGDTVKVQWTAALRKGRVLFSDMGRVLLSITEDSCAAHDTLLGGSTPQSNAQRYGQTLLRNSRDNFLAAAAKLGLTRRDIPPCVSFFAPIATDRHGHFLWREGVLRQGDFIDLRAEMNLYVVISNCPHPLAPGVYAPQPIEAIRYQAPPPAADDLCRNATAEARRGFANTDPLFAS